MRVRESIKAEAPVQSSDGAEVELGSAQAASVPALNGDANAAPKVERRAAIAGGTGHGFAQPAEEPGSGWAEAAVRLDSDRD